MDGIGFDFEGALDAAFAMRSAEIAKIRSRQKRVACRYYLQGRCMSGDRCEFMHTVIQRYLPKCKFFSRDTCVDPDCMYLHEVDEVARQACPAFERGYCRRGTACRMRHVKTSLCPYGIRGACALSRGVVRSGGPVPRSTWPTTRDALGAWEEAARARPQAACPLSHVPKLDTEASRSAFLRGEFMDGEVR